jgi:hypothetical protein
MRQKVNDLFDFLDKIEEIRYTSDILEEATWHAWTGIIAFLQARAGAS